MATIRAAATVAFFGLWLSMLPGASAADSNVRESVVAVVGEFVSAWNRHDTNTLAGLFAPAGRFTSPRGATAKGRHQIVEMLTQEHREIYQGTTLRATIDAVTFPVDDAALVTGSYTLSGIDIALGLEVSAEGSFDYRLTRRGDHWTIASARIYKQ
jgi:uncharacterized protein (TIGR02246 family)